MDRYHTVEQLAEIKCLLVNGLSCQDLLKTILLNKKTGEFLAYKSIVKILYLIIEESKITENYAESKSEKFIFIKNARELVDLYSLIDSLHTQNSLYLLISELILLYKKDIASFRKLNGYSFDSFVSFISYILNFIKLEFKEKIELDCIIKRIVYLVHEIRENSNPEIFHIRFSCVFIILSNIGRWSINWNEETIIPDNEYIQKIAKFDCADREKFLCDLLFPTIADFMIKKNTIFPLPFNIYMSYASYVEFYQEDGWLGLNRFIKSFEDEYIWESKQNSH